MLFSLLLLRIQFLGMLYLSKDTGVSGSDYARAGSYSGG